MPIIRRKRGASPDRIAATLKRQLVRILEEESDEIVAEAKRLVPVRTGALQRSIRKSERSEARGIRANVNAEDFVRTVSTDLPYAHLVEYGFTAGDTDVPGQPFLGPAVRAGQRRINARVRPLLKQSVEKARR